MNSIVLIFVLEQDGFLLNELSNYSTGSHVIFSEKSENKQVILLHLSAVVNL